MREIRLSVVLWLMVAATIQVSCERNEVLKPVADFEYHQFADSLVFKNLSENWMQCIWYFGDGDSVVNEEHPTHVYESDGQFTVQLVLWNHEGTAEIEKEIKVVFSDKPILVLEETEWGSQEIKVTNFLDNNVNRVGRLHLDVSPEQNFSDLESVVARYVSKDSIHLPFFTGSAPIGKGPEGTIVGLRPNTEYFVRARYEYVEEGETEKKNLLSEVLGFTTKEFPMITLSHNIQTGLNTVEVVRTEVEDRFSYLRKEISFYIDPERTREITPWRWNEETLTFLPHLGETIYASYTVEHEVFSDLKFTVTDEISFPYTFCFGDYKKSALLYHEKKENGGFLAIESADDEFWSQITFNCVKKQENFYRLNGDGWDGTKNYVILYIDEKVYLPSKLFENNFVESWFTYKRNLGYHYYAFNRDRPMVAFSIEGETEYVLLPSPLIRIDD